MVAEFNKTIMCLVKFKGHVKDAIIFYLWKTVKIKITHDFNITKAHDVQKAICQSKNTKLVLQNKDICSVGVTQDVVQRDCLCLNCTFFGKITPCKKINKDSL